MSKERIFVFFIIGIAIVLAVLAVTMNLEWLGGIIMFTRFFEIMLPVLGVGALIKYLCTFSCNR